MTQVTDAILHTLHHAGLSPAGPVLILCPPDTSLSAQFPGASIWHPFADQAARWSGIGHSVLSGLDDALGFQSVILFCPRQKEETLYLLAKGLGLLQDGGILIAACDNRSGGQTLPKLVQSLGVEANNLSKHKCRVVWMTAPQAADSPALARALEHGSPRLREDGFISQPGLFSWSRTDKGTDVLLHHLPFSFSGTGADFGCGIGILGRRLLQRHDSIAKLYCIDADSRAVACSRKNLEPWQERCSFVWADIRDLPQFPPLDFVVMNPPFHEGRADANLLGQNFITSAAAHLKPGGMLAMVANVHLPYEALLHRHFSLHRMVTEQDGFKIFEAVK